MLIAGIWVCKVGKVGRIILSGGAVDEFHSILLQYLNQRPACLSDVIPQPVAMVVHRHLAGLCNFDRQSGLELV